MVIESGDLKIGFGTHAVLVVVLFPQIPENCPTDPFTILEPRSQEIGEFDVVQKRRKADFEAQKL